MISSRYENTARAPERENYGFAPMHQGRDFESMVQTLSAGYGVFAAQPLGNDRIFPWAADLRRGNGFTVLHSVFQSSWTVRTLNETPQHLAFYLPHTGSFRVSIGKRSVESGAGHLLMANNHEADDRFVQGPHTSDVLFLDWGVVKRMLVSLMETPLSESLDLEPVLDLATQSGQLIGNLVQTIVQGMRNGGPLLSSPLAMATMSETLAHLVIRFGHHRLSGQMEKKKISLVAPWHVRRAIDYMHAKIAEPLTMAMVADNVGVSLRALQTGFKAFRGTSPACYLRSIRLQAAREQLRDPTNQRSVREICAIWGFAHAGRFSIIYRGTFGESPRDTRLRAERLR
ncbi:MULTISPECIES: AraC family transcriptional regulator [unclassified Rhizobium]|uniref:AraC family transcriptional regulator n=1 Tax=unclassified Rhizobium TaxID=2613769 RepID=UPI001A985011|nr:MULTISPECIES: AraC family transcriptional regulator [unclassified Rhizobium]MBX5156881.1 AraC family transcriptional regulator [Rhizobium sp. NZLR8]MBX5166290.1 AraC family transcriptional regulator [Rhizobium sp. NZLR4b]MBX5168601.1 AraC family transcriptional regulator [Rhizobium sp. NZLR1b]MBX5181792.1 AraC family transcriptional regulator [Rhizobium sp. NZLR5]MBX5187866.1 AraC family transcriptional regulator [Rhizobium sp. NZLR3b]